MKPAFFVPSTMARRGLLIATFLAAGGRLITAVFTAQAGDLDAFSAYGFTVVFPLILILLLLSLGPSRNREGILMRLGTVAQLALIIAIPGFALQLLLGLPVVFLLVELFETRLPRGVREPIARLFVEC
jgi:hypothetical protein